MCHVCIEELKVEHEPMEDDKDKQDTPIPITGGASGEPSRRFAPLNMRYAALARARLVC